MAVVETVRLGAHMQKCIYCVDEAGNCVRFPLPPRREFKATMAMLRSAYKSAQAIAERHVGSGNKWPIGLSEEDAYGS